MDRPCPSGSPEQGLLGAPRSGKGTITWVQTSRWIRPRKPHFWCLVALPKDTLNQRFGICHQFKSWWQGGWAGFLNFNRKDSENAHLLPSVPVHIPGGWWFYQLSSAQGELSGRLMFLLGIGKGTDVTKCLTSRPAHKRPATYEDPSETEHHSQGLG